MRNIPSTATTTSSSTQGIPLIQSSSQTESSSSLSNEQIHPSKSLDPSLELIRGKSEIDAFQVHSSVKSASSVVSNALNSSTKESIGIDTSNPSSVIISASNICNRNQTHDASGNELRGEGRLSKPDRESSPLKMDNHSSHDEHRTKHHNPKKRKSRNAARSSRPSHLVPLKPAPSNSSSKSSQYSAGNFLTSQTPNQILQPNSQNSKVMLYIRSQKLRYLILRLF